MRSVALDLGAKSISFCEVRDGKVVARRTVSRIEELEPELGCDTPPARVALEASREAWFVFDLLEGWGNKPVLVDTTRVRQLGIGAHKRKTDRLDAEVLALAVEKGTIPKAHLLSYERQQVRTKLMVRHSLVKARAQLMVQVRGVLRAAGIRVAKGARAEFVAALDRTAMPAEVAAEIAPMRAVLPVLEKQIDEVENALVALCKDDPAVQLLMTAPGVALIVAAAFVSVIDQADRFASAHKVQSYLGLVPSEDTSGGRQRLGHITKHGNCYLRAALIQSAWNVLRSPDTKDPFVSWAKKLKARKAKPQVAAVAVARKLAGVLWAMWRRKRPYDPRWQHKLEQLQPALPPLDDAARAAAIARGAKKLPKPAKARPSARRKEATANAMTA